MRLHDLGRAGGARLPVSAARPRSKRSGKGCDASPICANPAVLRTFLPEDQRGYPPKPGAAASGKA